MSQRLARGKARVSVETFVISDRTTTAGTTLPAAALLSVSVRAQPWWESLTLYAGVRNILDAAYSVSGGLEHTQADIPQDGRNFNAGLEYRFGRPHARP